jgi:hypothetical protein
LRALRERPSLFLRVGGNPVGVIYHTCEANGYDRDQNSLVARRVLGEDFLALKPLFFSCRFRKYVRALYTRE